MTTAVPHRTPIRSDALALTPGQSVLLDALRLLAAQVVLLGHAFDFFDWNSSLHDPTHPQIQRLAVTVFFLISGFLIPWSVARRAAPSGPRAHARGGTRHANSRFGDYLVARGTRIYAGLIPALLFIALVDQLPANRFATDYPAQPGSGTFATWLGNLLHLQEFPGLGVPIFGSGDPLWSLAVEWWIYILFGLLVLRPRGPWLLLWIPALISVVWNSVGGTGDGIAIVWFIGWAVYRLWRRLRDLERSPGARRALWILGAFGLIAGVWSAARWGSRSHFGLDLPFAAAISVMLLAWVLALDRRRGSPQRANSGIGGWVKAGAGWSFTLYLTHFSVLTLLYEWRGQVAPPVLVLIAVFLCNAAAWLLSWCGERHTGRWREHIRRRIAGDAA